MPIFGKGFESPTSRRLVADKSATDRRRRKICFRFVEMICDQSPTCRRPVADCTVFIYENALHKLQEVLERVVLWLTFTIWRYHVNCSYCVCKAGYIDLIPHQVLPGKRCRLQREVFFLLLDIFSDVVWRQGNSRTAH